MVRPVGVFLLVFALLSLIVQQLGMFELLGATGVVLLGVDILQSRLSSNERSMVPLRERML